MRTDSGPRSGGAAAVDEHGPVWYPADSYARAIERRQRGYLRRLTKRAFSGDPPVQHDYACGTGCAIRTLHGLVRAAHGYDTTLRMLAEAAGLGGDADLHLVAGHGPVPMPALAQPPAIVTIFRLLLNAEDSIRDRAVAFASRALPHHDSGLLVVENHGNRTSLRHLRQWGRARAPWFAELTHAEVGSLLARHGFAVVDRRGFAFLTPAWYGRRWLRPIASVVDELASRLPVLSGWAVNVLYVARPARRRADEPADPAVGTACC